MKKKRTAAAILFAEIFLFTACPMYLSGASEKPVLTIWVDAASQYPVRMACYSYYYGMQNDLYQGTEEPLPELSWEIVDKSGLTADQLAQELETAVKGGGGPDLIYFDECNSLDRAHAMEENWLLELGDIRQLYAWTFEYSEGILAAGQQEGAQYILPVFVEYPFVFGLKEELLSAGINIEKTPSNLEQFLQMLIDASEKSGKRIFDDASAVDWIEACCLQEKSGDNDSDDIRLHTLLGEVRQRSGCSDHFFSPYDALSSKEYLLSGSSLSDKFQTAQNLALLDPESVVFLPIPSPCGEVRPVITHAVAVNANTKYPEEAIAFLRRFQTTFVSSAGETGDYPAMWNDEFCENQLPLASSCATNTYLDEYASQANAFYSDAACNQSFLVCMINADGTALFKPVTDSAGKETKGAADVITVAFCDDGMGKFHVLYQWLENTASEMEEVHIQLIPFQSRALSAVTDQMEQAGAGPDILLSAADVMEAYGISDSYMDLSELIESTSYSLITLSNKAKGLLYGIQEESERQYIFAISDSSMQKEKAIKFCMNALENSLYKDTMDTIGLTVPASY